MNLQSLKLAVPRIQAAAIGIAAVALVGTSVSGSEIEVVVDQYQLDGSEQNNLIHSTRSLGQTFLVGIPGTLAAIELSLYSWYLDPGDELTIEILDATGGPAGAPVLGTTTICDAELGPSPQYLDFNSVTATLIDVSSLGLKTAVGDVIGIRLSSDAVLPAAFYVKNSFSNPYLRGAFFSNDSFWENHDLAFKIFVATTQIFADGFESGDASAWSDSVPCTGCPVAEFSFSSLGFQVQFNNQSTGQQPLSYQWDFGDGNSSTETNPTHNYASAGTYNVTLTVVNHLGMDSVTKPVTVSP